MAKFEYRVIWQRVGLGRARAFFQTEQGAHDKKRRLIASDEGFGVKRQEWDESPYHDPFADMPKLVEPPTIERREVGPWTVVE